MSVCFGTGFTRTVSQPDGAPKREPDLTSEQEDGLFEFVSGGKGTSRYPTGQHGGLEDVLLISSAEPPTGIPPGDTFTVNIDDSDHPITQGVGDFEVEDEIYMSAYDPYIRILASAEWSEKQHPMAWVKSYGDGTGVLYVTRTWSRHI